MLLAGNASTFLVEGLLKKHNSLRNHIFVEFVVLLLMYGLVYKKEKLFSFRKIISFFSWSYELVLIFLGCFLWHYIQLSFFIKVIILYQMISIPVYVALSNITLHYLLICQCRIMKYIIPNSCISAVLEATKISKMVNKLRSSCFFLFHFPIVTKQIMNFDNFDIDKFHPLQQYRGTYCHKFSSSPRL